MAGIRHPRLFDGINHGICAALETHSTITSMQIYCMLELVSGVFSECLAELGEP